MTKPGIARIALTCASLFVWAAAAPVSSAAELPGLVGHWKLDEGVGVTAMDSSGLGRHGAITGGSYVTNGLAQITPNGYALRLNGAGGHMAIPDSADWNLTPSSTLTISLWVTLLEDRGAFHVFGKGRGCDGNWSYELARAGGNFFFTTAGGTVIANRTLQVGRQTHVAITYDRGYVSLYLDGLLAGSASAPMLATPAGPLLVGTSRSCGGQSFPGIVDDVRAYRGALTATEVEGLVQGATFQPVPLALSWPVRKVNTTLDAEALSATATVRGTFTYTPGLGTVLPVGPATLHVHFEPADRSRYTPADLSIQVQVVDFWGLVARLPLAVNFGSPMAVDETRNRLYVPVSYYTSPPETLFVLDGNNHTVLDRVAFPPLGQVSAAGVALDSRRNRVYVSTRDTRLWVLDATTHEVIEIIELPSAFFRLVVNSTTGLVYMTYGTGGLMVVDPAKPAGAAGRVTAIAVPDGDCSGIDVNPIHNLVYLGAQIDGTCPLTVVDADPSRATYHTVLRVLPVQHDRLLMAFAVDRRNGSVYVVARNFPEPFMAKVLVVDGDPGKPSFHSIIGETSIDLRLAGQSDPVPVYGIAVNPNLNRVYVYASDPSGNGGASLWTFDASTNQVASVRRLPFWADQGYGEGPVINTATNRLYIGDGYETLVLEDSVPESRSTDPGFGAPVQVAINSVSITFAQVTFAGTTGVQPVAASSLNLTVPGAYSIDGAQAYEVTTTASVVAPITLCFNAWHVDDAGAFAALRVLHGENGALVDRTSSRDFATRTICATVSSLSPFVVARQTGPAYRLQLLSDNSKPVSGAGAIPVRVRLLDAAGRNASAANVPLRAVWIQRTPGGAPAPANDAGRANSGGLFRFDASLGGYIFNLETRRLAAGSYELLIEGPDAPLRYAIAIRIR